MTTNETKRILLAGYGDDLAAVAPLLRSTSAAIALVTEKALGDDIPKAVDIVVFVMSLDTCYSTQMHSLFVYVYDRVSAPEKYSLAVGSLDLVQFGFPEIAHLPRISIQELASLTKVP